MFEYDIFLAHNSSDKPAVEYLAHRLVEAGLRPWLDKWHLIPGQPWQEEIEEALDACRTVAVFLGPSGLGPWQNEEMRSALATRVHDRARRVIPVLLPGAPDPHDRTLPRFLRTTWVDFRAGLAGAEPFHRLLAGIRGVAPGPGQVESSPVGQILPDPAIALDQERASLRRQLFQHQNNLNKLREQAAIFGSGETPLHLLNKIEAEEAEIERLEKLLRHIG